MTDDPATLGPQDYVVITLKAHQVPGVVGPMQPLLGPDTAVVMAVNGVPWWYFYGLGGAYEGRRLPSVDPGDVQWDGIGPQRVIGCVVYPAAEVPEPGVIELVEGDRFTLGEPSGQEDGAHRAPVPGPDRRRPEGADPGQDPRRDLDQALGQPVLQPDQRPDLRHPRRDLHRSRHARRSPGR